jgi:hypothetical protein
MVDEGGGLLSSGPLHYGAAESRVGGEVWMGRRWVMQRTPVKGD